MVRKVLAAHLLAKLRQAVGDQAVMPGQQARAHLGNLPARQIVMDTVKEIDVTYDALADNKNIYLNDLREDIKADSFPTEKILQNAVHDENCFVVPKVVE